MFSATSLASTSGFLTSFISRKTSRFDNLVSLFLRDSMSAPFFPIIIPGLELYIEILNFFAALSILTFEILAFFNFSSTYFYNKNEKTSFSYGWWRLYLKT